MDIYVATSNPGKITELKKLTEDLSFVSWYFLEDLELPEETGSSFQENALIKAQFVTNHYECITLADDSGLVVDALDGDPGVFSARYAGPNALDSENRRKVIQELYVRGIQKSPGRFVCSLALCFPKAPPVCIEETCEGFVFSDEKGSSGFGYDSLFMPKESTKRFAEISLTEKNKVSHRGKALRKLKELLLTYGSVSD